ncbi:MAG TPA: TIGR02281 family clan AA aspartic protease [Paucimonas sp.]|nr:TIGR02281 family clan AA aspartic protease [Paucimonas sp.]
MKLSMFVAGCCLLAPVAQAADITVIGLFPGKAVLVVDGGAPKTYSVGGTIVQGIKLIAVGDGAATIDNHGKRETIAIGGHANRAAPAGNAQVTLQANGQGHFYTHGQINGGTSRMLVDTGATMIALPAAEALRLGINYKSGRTGHVSTANGLVPVYVVKLDTVKIGDIELHQVDAVVQESGLPIVLLGMSFLNRVEMRRDGEQMTLTKRY